MKTEIMWWLDRLVTLAKIAATIAITLAVIVAGGWVVTHFMMFVENDREMTAVGAGVVLFLGGVALYWIMHNCEGRRIFTCDSCEKSRSEKHRAETARRDAETREDQMRKILRALVFESQDELDELLGIFGERAQRACKEQEALQKMGNEGKLSAQQTLQLELVTNKISGYHRVFELIREHAGTFKRVVSERWRAYFPKQDKAA